MESLKAIWIKKGEIMLIEVNGKKYLISSKEIDKETITKLFEVIKSIEENGQEFNEKQI